jgi:serine/threonine protein kinase
MKVLIKLNNPNITKVYHLVKTHKTAFIFIDYFKNDSIQEMMSKNKKPFEENRTKLLFKDLVNGINYIHSEGIAYRGLSPKCFILDSNNKVMLCGFDFLCISISKYDKPIGSHSYGNIKYMLPEMKIGEFERFCFDARASDIY